MKTRRAAGVLLALLMAFFCAAPVAMATGAQPDVRIVPSVTLDSTSLTMRISIINESEQDVTIQFPTRQRFDFELYNSSNRLLYSYSDDMSFARRSSAVTVEAGKTLTYTQTLSDKDYTDIKNNISYMRAFITGSADFINRNGYIVTFDSSLYVQVTPRVTKNSASMRLSLSIKNTSIRPMKIKHATGQKYEFELLDKDGNVLYTWSKGRTFKASGSTTEIGPGATLSWSATLPSSAYKAVKGKAVSVRAYIIGSADFVDENGYDATIK